MLQNVQTYLHISWNYAWNYDFSTITRNGMEWRKKIKGRGHEIKLSINLETKLISRLYISIYTSWLPIDRSRTVFYVTMRIAMNSARTRHGYSYVMVENKANIFFSSVKRCSTTLHTSHYRFLPIFNFTYKLVKIGTRTKAAACLVATFTAGSSVRPLTCWTIINMNVVERPATTLDANHGGEEGQAAS